MRLARPAAFALATLLLAGCGGDSTGPDGGGSKSMTASVAGASWTANPIAISAVRSGTVLTFAGSDVKVGTTTQINITLPNVNGPGTYQLTSNFVGQQALLTITTGTTPAVWTTALPQSSGSVTITTLDAERVVGTFSFTAVASAGTTATGQRVVSNGSFNIAF